MLVSLTFGEISTTMPLNSWNYPSTRRLLWISLWVCACLIGLACQPVAESPPPSLSDGPVARFFEQPPSTLLDLDDLYTLQPTREWSLRRGDEVEAWTSGNNGALTPRPPLPRAGEGESDRDAEIPLQASSAGLLVTQTYKLSREVDLAAAEVQQIEVELDPSAGGAILRLYWRRHDEGAVLFKRSLQATPGTARGEQRNLYRFEVARRPSWRGQIAELALEVRPHSQLPPRLRRIVASGRRLERDAFAKVAGQSLLVELEHEVREALLAPPGSSIVRRLDVGANDQLVFAYGTEASVRSAVEFRVVVSSDSAGSSSAGSSGSKAGGETILWRDTVGLANPGKALGASQSGASKPWGQWHEARVDLSSVQGQGKRLRLETHVVDGKGTEGSAATTEEDYDIDRGFPLWGHPEVLRSSAASTSASTSNQPPNLLFISLDTVRADRLSLYGHDKPTSPRLDAWAGRSAAVFEQTVAAAPWTLPSHMTLFSGLDALRHGFNHDVGRSTDRADRGFDLLAEILRQQGYATAATTGGAYLHPRYGFSRGFNTYRYWNDRARDADELSDGVDRTLSFMDRVGPRPFFFFFHTYAAHDPYEAHQPFFDQVAPPGVEAVDGEIALHSPPNEESLGFEQQIYFELRQKGRKRRLSVADRPLLQAFYDSGLARVDAEVGRLLDGLKARGLQENTVVVITSDHGENLLDAGRPVGHLDLYDSNLMVPLIIAWPDGRGAGKRIPQQVRSTDIFPTVLASLGLDVPANLDGVSLLPWVEADADSPVPLSDEGSSGDATNSGDAWSYSASANRGLALRSEQHKLIVNNNAWRPQRVAPHDIVAGGREVYDLAQDPEEQVDLWPGSQGESFTDDDPAHQASRAKLLRALEAYWQANGQGLRLTLHNPGPGTLEGTLRGPMVRPVATKSIDLACRCLFWQEMGQARFELAAGRSFTLQFEKVFGPQLEIEGVRLDGAQRDKFQHTFDADRIEAAEVLQWGGDGRWQTSVGPEDALLKQLGAERRADGKIPLDAGRPFFLLRWQGKRQGVSASPSLSDPELRRQLEALGYL